MSSQDEYPASHRHWHFAFQFALSLCMYLYDRDSATRDELTHKFSAESYS